MPDVLQAKNHTKFTSDDINKNALGLLISSVSNQLFTMFIELSPENGSKL